MAPAHLSDRESRDCHPTRGEAGAGEHRGQFRKPDRLLGAPLEWLPSRGWLAVLGCAGSLPTSDQALISAAARLASRAWVASAGLFVARQAAYYLTTQKDGWCRSHHIFLETPRTTTSQCHTHFMVPASGGLIPVTLDMRSYVSAIMIDGRADFCDAQSRRDHKLVVKNPHDMEENKTKPL